MWLLLGTAQRWVQLASFPPSIQIFSSCVSHNLTSKCELGARLSFYTQDNLIYHTSPWRIPLKTNVSCIPNQPLQVNKVPGLSWAPVHPRNGKSLTTTRSFLLFLWFSYLDSFLHGTPALLGRRCKRVTELNAFGCGLCYWWDVPFPFVFVYCS